MTLNDFSKRHKRLGERKFSGRDAEIVAKFKQGGRTKTDIGREYGISCERVRQIVWRAARAMNRLREDWE
jgi:DNA-directed RNA polymerase sigma subunit (sigma70/sigma32)